MMGFMVVCANQITVDRDVVTQQRVGHHAFTAAEVFTRMPSLYCRPLEAKLLAVNDTIKRFWIKQIVRDNRQCLYGIGDAVIGRD